MTATAYRCPLCGFHYYDHGPDSMTSQHRRIMAAFRVAKWEEAERLVAARAPAVSDDPSWEGQECGDRSARAGSGTSCPGRLVLAATSGSTMNMNHNPTVEQLAALLRACNDTAAHHILWVAKDGEVRVTPLPKGMYGADFGERPDLRLRHETFVVGNGYVGPAAADDTSYVKELLADLVRGWRDGIDYLGD